MRRSVLSGALITVVLLPAGVGVATTPPDTTVPGETEPTPPPTEPGTTGTAPAATEPAAAEPAAEPVEVYDEDGSQVAFITVTDVETGLSDYPEDDTPEEGNEYVRMTVLVESTIPEDSFGIAVDHFILQSNTGLVTTAENIRTAEQAEADEDVPGDADLEIGEATELTLTFEVVASDGPQSVFYRPDDGRLVDIFEFG